MSRNDEQLDLLLRQTLGGKTFEQKPHYWEGAKQLIDTHRKQRNRNLIFYSVSVALVAVVASAWILSSSPKSTTTPSSENELAFASVNPTNPNTTEQGNPAPKLSSSVGSAVSQTESSQSVEATPASTHSLTASSSQTQTPSNTTNNNANTTQRKHKRSTSPVVSSEQQIAETDNQSETPVEQTLYTREPERITFRKAVFAPKFTTSFASDTFSRKSFEQAYTQRTQQQLWMLEAGLNSYNGLSANIHGGIRYMRFVSPTLALSIGATYAQLHQDMSRTYHDIDYTFGQQIQETNIQTQRIDYIELPVAVHYAINTKHLINLGCIPAYALHTKDKVTYSLGETPQSGNIAYMDAINRFDLQLQAGYSFRINPTWMLSANYQFGLMDISNNNVFKSTNFDRNQGLRLTLGYKLF